MDIPENAVTLKAFPHYTCRLCYFQNDANIHIFSPTGRGEELSNKISKHLSFEVTEEDEYPKWICSLCRRSLNNFHGFYNKVDQVQSNLRSILSTVKGTSYNVGETPRIEHIKIECDVLDFHGGSNTRTGTTGRMKKKRGRRPRTRGTLSAVKKKEPDQSSEINAAHEPKDETLKEKEIELKEEEIITPTDQPETVQSIKEDDQSSLEDQDWVDQITFFSCEEESAGSDEDELWKPSTSCGLSTRRSRGRPRKVREDSEVREKRSRKRQEKRESNGDKDDSSENCGEWDEEEGDNTLKAEPKKKKLRITATHGTMPKPRMPPGSRKMMRAQMNSMMVQFYGITCDICINKGGSNPLPVEPIKYQTFEDLCEHMQKEHNERGYVKCCNCTMRERKRAERHMLLHTMPGSVYKCNICGKQLSSQQSFRCHILLHLPDKDRPYRCGQCERGFVTKADLTQHEHQHLPEDKRFSYTCDICGSRFSYESGLMIHKQRVHENIRTHLCDICAKSFNSRCDMERHREQIHGNVKREQCPECGKWFKGPSILKTHMRQHRGVVYQCQFCEKKYSVRSSWKAHLLRHSDEKPHKCPMCDKTFKLPGTLKMHLNQHTGELPYACPFCPKKFASSGNYYTHRKRMHREEVAQMKEATEAALAASGLPPPSTIPPPTTTQSISQAIARAKAAASANAAAAAAAAAVANAAASANTAVVANATSPSVGSTNINVVTNSNVALTNVVHATSVVTSTSTVEVAANIPPHGALNTVVMTGIGLMPPTARAVIAPLSTGPPSVDSMVPNMGQIQSLSGMTPTIRSMTTDLRGMTQDMRVMTDMRVIPSEMRVLTSDMRTDLRTMPSDVRTMTSSDIRPMPSVISADMRPMSSVMTADLRPMTAMATMPLEIRTLPPDIRAMPQDIRSMPQDVRGMGQGAVS